MTPGGIESGGNGLGYWEELGVTPDELPTEGWTASTGGEVGVVLVASAARVAGMPDMEDMLKLGGVPLESPQPPSASGTGVDIAGNDTEGTDIEGIELELTVGTGVPLEP